VDRWPSVELICDTASRIADIYQFAMEWTQSIRTAHFHELLTDAQEAMCDFSKDFVQKIELVERTFRTGLQGIDEKLAAGETVDLSLKISLEATGVARFSAALDRATEIMESRKKAGKTPF
jgi:hypothetical protein